MSFMNLNLRKIQQMLEPSFNALQLFGNSILFHIILIYIYIYIYIYINAIYLYIFIYIKYVCSIFGSVLSYIPIYLNERQVSVVFINKLTLYLIFFFPIFPSIQNLSL